MVSYYAVHKGNIPGIYDNWDKCKEQVNRYRGAIFKKFTNKEEAEHYFKTGKEKIVDIVLHENTLSYDIIVYTDGSCKNNGSKDAKAGIGIYFGKDDKRNVSKKLVGYSKVTNNIAELSAVLDAIGILLDEIGNNKYICIYTDSEYVMKCCSTYGEKQKNKEWKDDIPNKDLVKGLFELFETYKNIKLHHIKAHTGNNDKHSIGNAEADRLANEAADS